MSDYRVRHLSRDLPPVIQTPDLVGAGGPAPAKKAAKTDTTDSPAQRDEADEAAKPEAASGAGKAAHPDKGPEKEEAPPAADGDSATNDRDA